MGAGAHWARAPAIAAPPPNPIESARDALRAPVLPCGLEHRRISGCVRHHHAVSVATGALILIFAVSTGNVAAVLAAAPVFGCGYGLCMVSGLTTVQSLVQPDEPAGITAVFYALSYAGFFIPVIFAALASVVGNSLLLSALAMIILICAGVSSRSRAQAANSAQPVGTR